MIIGTAGHIDHGKTTLVRALTGVDTDRLDEEKTRGMTIELGYAYVPLADGSVLGFVDVPGHERLVRTMVAGACGIDFALLVVAADDGVMPQTLEHIAILELLGVSQGAVALTKIDRVDAARQGVVEAAIRHALAGTALAAAPIFAVSAAADADPGTLTLRRHLEQAAAHAARRRDDALFRLAVDRVFTLAGHGTVVTGTVFSGRIAIGDKVLVMPARVPVRARGIHAQQRPALVGRAGERCALNLAGIDKEGVARGDWLAAPGLLVPSERFDVRLHTLPATSALRLAQGTPVHVHIGTAHHVAHVVPLESTAIAAGESTRAQLVFDAPMCALPGDRFIVRDAGAARTIGGGVVLDAEAPRRKRRAAARIRRLDALEQIIADGDVTALLLEAPFGIAMSELVRTTGLAPERIRLPADVRVVDSSDERFVLLERHWTALRERALGALRDFHAATPDEPGPDAARLRRIAFPALPPVLWAALVDALVRDGEIVRRGAWLRAPEHEVTLSDEDRSLAERLAPLIAAGRFNPPWVRDLASALDEPEERVREVLRKQVRQGTVCQVMRDLFYDSRCIGELAEIVAMLERTEGAATAARYRDALGVGRKRAIQILEFFDRVGYTRRVRDAHVLRRDSHAAPETWKAHAPGGAAGLQTRAGASDASR